ncbi:GNAT family N-acetyltransferase [Streptoalloteichus hindustanus]|uniref:Diamine N-acetyltransferase n=1 Tax=Streptoalloteichus hindustanus TaxID=2017 RepID=A0A1M5MPL5_STRHI|nr:GNAT family N-acetyltransferase [Streptoalloteichus hindustanus]SHG79360.1 diamine N-acetyltransferase [Streptoalloteichus hindustanus]
MTTESVTTDPVATDPVSEDSAMAELVSTEPVTRDSEVTLRRVTALNVPEVCALSRTLSERQRYMVADNGTSLAEGFCSQNSWFRAVYADETPVGFVMLHYGADWDDGIDCEGAYLWRLMIATPFQGMGFARRTLDYVAREVRARGYRELFTSYVDAEDGPEKFYERLGFVRTGVSYDNEVEAVLRLAG